MSTLAIMQPTFLPWLGYFALIDAVDNFVFYDDVQFSKQSWQSRNRIAGPDKAERLLSLSVASKPSKPRICDVRLAPTGFERSHMASLVECYGKAPFGAIASKLVEDAFAGSGGELATLNIGFITAFADLIGLNTRLHRASNLRIDPADRSERLMVIAESFGATHYVSPVGSLHYLSEDDAFTATPIRLSFLNFEHPVYPQFAAPFRSHLAAIDALAHLGPEAIVPLIRDHRGPHLSMDQLQDA